MLYIVNCEVLKEIHVQAKLQIKYISMVILFDVGGPIMADNALSSFIMVGSQSNFQILDHLYQDLCSSYIKSDAWTEFSG